MSKNSLFNSENLRIIFSLLLGVCIAPVVLIGFIVNMIAHVLLKVSYLMTFDFARFKTHVISPKNPLYDM